VTSKGVSADCWAFWVSGAEPIEVQIRLESSSRWPEELEAFRTAKTAFLIQIARG
jgi:hypothetical protein